ncbi:Homeotic protein proboscipedia [Pseudolycoriella hygida]|uniref:Homeotic protein proboscipedia n=1 Tax=Pseudolycoriella hygida TaxID=35572 RepID=A0A9Q0MX49_9DIPT|nr:Homeotic protein proboscipedia [Pseudolycoriella hygida]
MTHNFVIGFCDIIIKVKVWFQNRRMKHKRQTLSKSEDDENKDSLKGDDDSQQCNSSSKKSCQGCELPSDDVPDSTSNSRGHNNNTPSATNNNSNNGSVTPTLDTTISTNTNGITNINIISADSSVASSVSLDEEEESQTKTKKKDNALVQVVKKESMLPKDQFYNNMDMYRRDNDAAPMIGENNLSATANYSQSSHKFNKNSAAGVIHDGYPSHAYYRKQQEYYGKYEVEFAHHQKSLIAPTQAEYHYQKTNFPHVRPDFHHLKGDFHGVKPELNYKVHDVHGKAHNFHRNQNYYNQHNATNPATPQYPNQYYHNEYEVPPIDSNNFYDSKTQTNYYENANYYPNEYAGEPYAPPSIDNCDNYTYPQYFEASQQMVHVTANTQPIQSNSTHSNNQHLSEPNYTQCSPSYERFIEKPTSNTNGNHNIGNLENNSNSSSDFTFLSNLANDFAPEYYQLI